jgi:hypothetical protein
MAVFCAVDLQVETNVSKAHIASIFRNGKRTVYITLGEVDLKEMANTELRNEKGKGGRIVEIISSHDVTTRKTNTTVSHPRPQPAGHESHKLVYAVGLAT